MTPFHGFKDKPNKLDQMDNLQFTLFLAEKDVEYAEAEGYSENLDKEYTEVVPNRRYKARYFDHEGNQLFHI